MDEEKGKKSKVLIVDNDAIIKPFENGTNIVIPYDSIRAFIPELQGKDNGEIKGILRELSQEELKEIFAGGMYHEAKATTERVIPGAILGYEKRKEEEERARRAAEEGIRKAEEEQKRKLEEQKKELEEKQKQEENKKRRLLLIPVFLVVGSLSLAGMLKGCHNDRNNNKETTEQTTEEKEDTDKSEDKEITQSQYLEFDLYEPNDSVQLEKANVDFGNQESESNYRKEGKTTHGDKEWEAENKAVKNYPENQKNIKEIEKYRQIILRDTASYEEKMEALNKMLKPSYAIEESFDSNRFEEETEYAVKQSQKHPDEKTDIEVENAKNLINEYNKQKNCQKENVEILMYIQYLADQGYDISDFQITQNARKDLKIKMVCEREVEKSKAEIGGTSFEEFKQELDEYTSSGKDKKTFLEDFESKEIEKSTKNTEETEKETIELSNGMRISFGLSDYSSLASSRNSQKVDKATKNFKENIFTRDKNDEGRI